MRWQWKYISCFHPATRSSVQSIASALLVTSVRIILQAVEMMMKNFILNDFMSGRECDEFQCFCSAALLESKSYCWIGSITSNTVSLESRCS